MVFSRRNAVFFFEAFDEKIVVIITAGLGGCLQGFSLLQHIGGVLHTKALMILFDGKAGLLFEPGPQLMIAQLELCFIVLCGEVSVGIGLDKFQHFLPQGNLVRAPNMMLLTVDADHRKQGLQLCGTKGIFNIRPFILLENVFDIV